MSNRDCSLRELERRAQRELELTAHPSLDWMPQTLGPDNKPAVDVLIVGAGQGGSALAFKLKRERVHNVVLIDRAPAGLEGPWRTFARMPTLRSPKDYSGPDLDMPSLTYRAWHEARFGARSWQELELIKTEAWAEYLDWIRTQTGVNVRSECDLVALEPVDREQSQIPQTLLKATLRRNGSDSTIYCRRLVLATGQDGTGHWVMPDFIERLPRSFRSHTVEEIDFASLKDKQIAVLGAGASAADSAAVALEHGAKAVHMFVRRKRMQRIQPYRWITFRGFLRHLCDLDDPWRWRFMHRVLSMRESIPQATYDRMRRWPNFEIHVACAWHGAEVINHSNIERVRIETEQGPFEADYVICGTGIDIDFVRRAELRKFAGQIKTWADAYQPPENERDERLARYPYLSRDGHYVENIPGTAPHLQLIYDFTIAATMSFGPSGASINAMTTAVPRLSAAITKSLFREDVERHWQSFLDYDTPVFVPWGKDHEL